MKSHGSSSLPARTNVAAPLVICHVSHLYATGASLYFTILAAQDRSDPVAQWRGAKRAATDAIVAAGATITHHHAVGADHAPWLEAEIGVLAAPRVDHFVERGLCRRIDAQTRPRPDVGGDRRKVDDRALRRPKMGERGWRVA